MDKETILKLRKLCLGFKVLCVEDDENISKQLHRILNKIISDADIDIEDNGETGLEKYKEYKHDIVITDISMPRMNGVKMAHEIKKIYKDQTIIVISAHSETKYMTSLIDVGVDKFILKPIEIENFLEVLAKIAVRIFKEKKQKLVDSKIQEQVKIGQTVLSEMITPIAIVQESEIKYVNKVFKNYFLKELDGDIAEFNISYIFKDKELIVLNNKDIVERLSSLNEVYEIYHADTRTYKRYKIHVVSMDDGKYNLLNFINIDFAKEAERSYNNNTGFPNRRTFIEKMQNINNNDEDYIIFCFGLKNLQAYIKEYGAKQINLINRRIATIIKKEFHEYLENGEVSIYLFETNRYILVANEKTSEIVKNILADFGKNHKCSKGRQLSFYLDFISKNLDKKLSQKDIIENAEAMLYLLKE